MFFKLGKMILLFCLVLVERIMGGHWPYYVELQPSMETIEEIEAIKDDKVMMPSLPEGLDIPLEILWNDVLKNPSVITEGVAHPETIISPTEEQFNMYFQKYISDSSPSDKSRSEIRRHLLLDYLSHQYMSYASMMESLEEDKQSDGIQFQNLNDKALNFTLDQDEMLLINGIRVTEVRSRESDKGPIIYVIAGILFDHKDIVKPKRDHQKNVNETRIDGRTYLEPSY